MRNKQNEKVLVVRITQIGNLRKGNTSFVSLKSVIFEKGYSVVSTCMNLMKKTAPLSQERQTCYLKNYPEAVLFLSLMYEVECVI